MAAAVTIIKIATPRMRNGLHGATAAEAHVYDGQQGHRADQCREAVSQVNQMSRRRAADQT